MASIANIDLERRRHDTYPDGFTITDPNNDDNPVNVSGFVFRLTVNSERKPVNQDNEVFQILGSITDGPNGKVEFAPSDAQSDQTPGTYYYDIQMIDGSSRRRTVAYGKYKFIQDITKDS